MQVIGDNILQGEHNDLTDWMTYSNSQEILTLLGMAPMPMLFGRQEGCTGLSVLPKLIPWPKTWVNFWGLVIAGVGVLHSRETEAGQRSSPTPFTFELQWLIRESSTGLSCSISMKPVNHLKEKDKGDSRGLNLIPLRFLPSYKKSLILVPFSNFPKLKIIVSLF